MQDNQKVMLVTGSAKGLGKALIKHFARLNYYVLIHYRSSRKSAEILVKELHKEGFKASLFRADLTKIEEVKQLFLDISLRAGRLDILVNNIGNYLKKDILEVSFQEWNELITNNLHTAFYCSQLAIPLMQRNRYGRIINIGFASVGKVQAEPDITPYFIAKNGLLVLTKSMASALASQNILVNMVSPGVLENSESKPIEEIPLGRVASFSEFISAVEYLISDKASYITGTNLEVAGAWKL